MIVDAHTHTWGEDTAELPWQGHLPEHHPYHRETYTHREHIANMDKMGVEKSVVVNMGMVYGDGVRGNEYTMRSIEAHPNRLYGVGSVRYKEDGEVPSSTTLRENVRRVTGHDNMLGVRMLGYREYNKYEPEMNPTSDWMLDSNLEPVWKELAELGKAMYILPRYQQLDVVEQLAADHPDVTIILDHMAWPDDQPSPDDKPWAHFSEVAEHDNTYVKISSVAEYSHEGWPYEDMWPYMENLLEWFGSDRLIFGTDYPYNAKWGTYEECVSWFHEADFLSPKDRKNISSRTFLDVHDI